MGYYRYKGRDRRGVLKSGKIKADSHNEALAKLKESKVKAFEVKELDGWLYKEINMGNPVKNKDFVIYLRQLSTLIDAGISLIDATYILKDQTDSRALKKDLRIVAKDLEAGYTFTDAVEKHRKTFPLLFVNMMRAGEAAGNLDEILERLANYYEKQYELKQKVISALSYPFVVGIIALGIVFFMLSFVVPRFGQMFTSFGGEIPAFTQLILSAGEFASHYWWFFLILPVIVFLTYKLCLRLPNVQYYVDYIKMRIPLFGKLIQKAMLARMTRTLGSLFSSSVPVLHAVEITEKIVGNKVIEEALKESKDSLEAGESFADPFIDHWAFPSLVTQMIVVGEKTGSLDHMLNKVADFYEKEIDHATDRIKTLIEPILIVVLALIVGSVVMAIAVPMFSIFEQI